MFADFATVDPCSLTSLETFAEFGDAQFAQPESLDYCTIAVSSNSGGPVTMAIGLFEALDALPADLRTTDELEGGMWVAQRDADPANCTSYLVFPDDIALQVRAAVFNGEPPAHSCEMVDAGIDKVVEVITANEVEHRDPPAGSLIQVDACELAPPTTVEAVTGLAGAKQTAYPGQHLCLWEGTTDDALMRIQLGVGPMPTVDSTGANANPVAGRPSVTRPFETDSNALCFVETGQVPFYDVAGQVGMVELATVYVRMDAGQTAAACQAATAVASQVWPKLPPV